MSATTKNANPFPMLKAGEGLVYQPVPHTLTLPSTNDKKKVFLTTVRIPDEHIWANGLFQNVYVIYKMFETMGCAMAAC